jgi:hypothetical protein
MEWNSHDFEYWLQCLGEKDVVHLAMRNQDKVFWTRPYLINALEQAKRRGLDINILTESEDLIPQDLAANTTILEYIPEGFAVIDRESSVEKGLFKKRTVPVRNFDLMIFSNHDSSREVDDPQAIFYGNVRGKAQNYLKKFSNYSASARET